MNDKTAVAIAVIVLALVGYSLSCAGRELYKAQSKRNAWIQDCHKQRGAIINGTDSYICIGPKGNILSQDPYR